MSSFGYRAAILALLSSAAFGAPAFAQSAPPEPTPATAPTDGGDIIVTAGADTLAKMASGRTRAVVNCANSPTAAFTRNPDWQFPLEKMRVAVA
ncbi:MAG: hypothetical protein WCS75_10320, partial [Sphingomonas sp.]